MLRVVEQDGVDVVAPEAPAGAVELGLEETGVQHVLRQPAVEDDVALGDRAQGVEAVGVDVADLGHDEDVVTGIAGELLADQQLGRAVPVVGSGVHVVAPEVEGVGQGVPMGLVGVGDPVGAEADRRQAVEGDHRRSPIGFAATNWR